MPTTLTCDAATATLTGTYPVCASINLQPGQQVLPLRAESAGLTTMNVSCTAGFMPDGAVTSSSFALGSCTLNSTSSVVVLPTTSSFSCIPNGASAIQLFRSVDFAQWWLTSDSSWTTTAQSSTAVLLHKMQVYSGGTAFFAPLQVRGYVYSLCPTLYYLLFSLRS